MLDGLLSVPFEFVLGQSFTFLSKPATRERETSLWHGAAS